MNISEEHGWSSVTASSSDYDMTASSSDYDTPSRSLPTSSSSSYMSIASTLSSVYYSPRIQRMIDNQSRFSTDMDRNIEYSRDHWSELTDSSTDSVATPEANRAHFEKLKAHPRWGGFFKDVRVELGEKINEGAQAEIYDAKVEFEDGRKSPGYGYHVVKIMKGDCPLEIFRRQWPVSMLCNASKGRVKGPLMWIEGGTMVDDRFAFVMVRQWGDLRKLIDTKMRLNNNRGPPFTDFEFVRKIMLCIARDMDALHTKYKIVHRDLKASNVLLWSFGEQLPDANPHVKASVVDYECSVGVVGTGFWRAPEIIEQVKKGTPSSKQVFTFESDVYSYGMLCYELLTGRIPFEGHYSQDIVLAGQRPELPQVPWENRFLVQCVEMCWSEMPWVRPKFSEIVKILEAPASPLSSSSSEYYSPCVDWVSSNRNRFASGWETASSGVMLRKWGDLRKFIDMKRKLNNNQGPPFVSFDMTKPFDNNQGPPFLSFDFVRKVMLCIAKDMDALHTKDKVIYRDLRASNVLLWSVGDQLPDANPHVRATVVDYKCWSELVGPGLLSAPEILELLKEGTPSSEMVSTFESDVYNYATVCYELLTGHTPFEGNFYQNLILDGNRPELPQVPRESRDLVQCVEMCWSEMPWLRPTFSEIVKILEAPASSSSSSSPGNRTPCVDWVISRGVHFYSRRESFSSGIMVRQWVDLRQHIDMKMRLNNNQGPPFASFEFVRKVMLCIARDMDALHTKYGIVHRDLKASNVLLWSSGEQLSDANPHVKANVAYYQILKSWVRTDFWRFAPEILKQVNMGIPTHYLQFTYESDVYSYGMVCYELLTGRTLFEGRSTRDYDAAIRGDRPELPQVPWESRLLVQCVRMCWSSEFERPTFSEIVKILEAAAPSTSSSLTLYCSRLRLYIPMTHSSSETVREPGLGSSRQEWDDMRKWGNLRMLIDMKMQLNNNQGPPFADLDFVRMVMLCIAIHMKALHTIYKIVLGDLKASKVHLWSVGEQLPDADCSDVKVDVVNFESSVGVTGTGFWRAPEILEQLKKGTPTSELVFTFASDVYSYGQVCYELLTGCTPCEGHSSRDYDMCLPRIEPDYGKQIPTARLVSGLIKITEMCLREESRERPTFSYIVEELLEFGGPVRYGWRMSGLHRGCGLVCSS